MMWINTVCSHDGEKTAANMKEPLNIPEVISAEELRQFQCHPSLLQLLLPLGLTRPPLIRSLSRSICCASFLQRVVLFSPPVLFWPEICDKWYLNVSAVWGGTREKRRWTGCCAGKRLCFTLLMIIIGGKSEPALVLKLLMIRSAELISCLFALPTTCDAD